MNRSVNRLLTKPFLVLAVLCLLIPVYSLSEALSFAPVAVPDFTLETASGDTFSLTGALSEGDFLLLFVDSRISNTEAAPLLEQVPDLPHLFLVCGEEAALPEDFADPVAICPESLVPFVQSLPGACIVHENLEADFLPLMTLTDPFSSDDVPTVPAAQTLGGLSLVEPAEVTLSVLVTDQSGDPVPGAFVTFCTDVTCLPVSTDASGTASITLPSDNYHVQILKVPDGYSYDVREEIQLTPDLPSGQLHITKN
ncbi:MAG: carboxypeptidase regulatory-like domain-containing protein [Clostridia bacterium]|nr:carboxypeptidase regulatory-like domain-containing protein [Clostridia bacterium]